MSRNDLILVIALHRCLSYKLAYDKVLSFIQRPDIRGFTRCACDEFASIRFDRRCAACRQACTFGSLRRFIGLGAVGLAKGLGWAYICKPRRFWNRHRDCSAHDEFGQNRIHRRYLGQPFGDGLAPHIFSLCLDKASTLTRRHLCAA